MLARGIARPAPTPTPMHQRCHRMHTNAYNAVQVDGVVRRLVELALQQHIILQAHLNLDTRARDMNFHSLAAPHHETGRYDDLNHPAFLALRPRESAYWGALPWYEFGTLQ